MIEQDKKTDKLMEEVASLKNENAALKTRIRNMESE